jgi:hypothetical protein
MGGLGASTRNSRNKVDPPVLQFYETSQFLFFPKLINIYPRTSSTILPTTTLSSLKSLMLPTTLDSLSHITDAAISYARGNLIPKHIFNTICITTLYIRGRGHSSKNTVKLWLIEHDITLVCSSPSYGFNETVCSRVQSRNISQRSRILSHILKSAATCFRPS